MTTLFLTCFIVGLVLSVLAAVGGLGHLHFGHAHPHVHAHANTPGTISALNGFTLPAFLCWFGGIGYLLLQDAHFRAPLALLLAIAAGLVGASLYYAVLFKFLLPHERVLSPEDTRMDGVVARVSDEIRPDGGTGEIIFSQTGARRGAAARSESGVHIPRGTEVVVLRYIRGIAYVSPLDDLIRTDANSSPNKPSSRSPQTPSSSSPQMPTLSSP